MTSTIKYPKGFKTGGQTQVAVRFDDPLFKDIIARAKRENRDFNSMVLYLCQCGSLCLDESDALEPKDRPDDRTKYVGGVRSPKGLPK